MRAFLALPLPDPIVTDLERLQQSIPCGRLVPAENLHLTLVFLDERSETELEEMHFALETFRAPALELRVNGLDIFGAQIPTSLHATIAPNPSLNTLHQRLRAALHGAGLVLERSRFRPHITLARFSNPLSIDQTAKLGRFLQARADLALPAFKATGFTLFESLRTKDGPVYEALADYPLSGA
ncbi:MAG TPA: RNA 2',3'-cyclic phosphodiesterase [Rhodobacteraceae bacterium]|jgi:2'-5' RNA ligase|nr:RNA 2',3'-cyclic phosphodiesterase [Paracoccaceae bacterium]